MNVDCRRWGPSVVRIRILLAGLILLAMGCAFLGWGTRLGKTVRNQSNSQPFTAGLEQSAQLKAQAHSILAGLPLVFEPNQGQASLDPADPHAQFLTHGAGYSLVLGSDGAILSLASKKSSTKSTPAEIRSETFRMKVGGAASNARLTAADLLPGKSNYFIGNDPAKWRTGIPQFARVGYENLYPGINLVFYGNQGHLEYDFQVAPGANPSQAELEFSGAKKIELKDGALVISGQYGSIQFDVPSVYQEVDGRKQAVEGAFVLRAENRVGFAVGAYDHSRELIIDPTLSFASFLGGTGDEHNTFVAVDGSSNLYLTGSTTSPDLVAKCSYTTCGALNGTQNVYVAKIQPPLESIPAQIIHLSYLGGGGTDYPVGIGVDGGGNPYVAGTTTSGNFPTTPTNAYQATAAGTHVFVTKINSDFSQLLYSSYLSGNGTDIASGMTIDNQSNLYVTGTTTSIEASSSAQFPASNLPQSLPFQSLPRSSAGTPQFFVTKVYTNAGGIASIPYSTYFGGGTFTCPSSTPNCTPAIGGGIAVDTNSNVYFTGTTNFTYQGCTGCTVTDFPILNAYQPCLDTPTSPTNVIPQTCSSTGGASLPDAFVARLNTSPNVSPGQQLIWSTYIGGTGSDSGVGVAIDPGATNVYVVGTTDSTDFVPTNLVKSFASFQPCLNNVALGTTGCSTQTVTPVPTDAFVARLNNPASSSATLITQTLGYFSYLGGAAAEAGNAITVDTASGALITGSTASQVIPPATNPGQPQPGSFPVTPYPSSIQSQLNGTSDAFLARLNTAAVVGQTTTASWASYFGGSGTDAGTGIALDVNEDIFLVGETNSSDLPAPIAFQPNNNGGFDSFVAQFSPAYTLTLSGVLNLATNQHYISAGNPATFTYTLTNNGPDLASNVAILANFASTGVPVSNVSATISTGTCGGGGSSSTSISCGPISLQSGSTATVTISLTPTLSSTALPPVFFNGGTVQAIGADNKVKVQTQVTAQMSDFTMTVSPSNQIIAFAGNTAPYTVQLTPHPLYSSSITVSCSGLPAASTCSSKTVSLANQAGASVVLDVTTTARPATTPAASLFKRHFYAVWLMVPAMALVGVGGNRRRRRILGFLALCTLFTLALFVPACSSSKTTTPPAGTPAGNYTITITAAAGSDSKTQTVGLTVP